MASIRLFVAGASAVGASVLTSYLLLSDSMVSTQSNSHNAIKDPAKVLHERSLIAMHLIAMHIIVLYNVIVI